MYTQCVYQIMFLHIQRNYNAIYQFQKFRSLRCVLSFSIIQEISNRTLPERTPKKPEYLTAKIATYKTGFVGIRSNFILDG